MSAHAMKTIRIGRDQVSMIDPPNEGTVVDIIGREWMIKRTGSGNIILRPEFSGYQAHADFLPDGMELEQFCWWINQQYGEGPNPE